MTALKALAREKGYFNVSPWEQALRCVELAAAPALAFALLTMGGVAAVVGSLHYPRTAFLGHDLAHNHWGPRNDAKPRFMLGLVALFQGFGSTWWVEKHELHHAFPNACRVDDNGVLTPIDGDIDSSPWIVWDKALSEHNSNASKSPSLCAAHWILGLALAMLLTPGPAWTGAVWFLGAQLVGGFLLAIVFVLNHTGMGVYDASEAGGFYDRQARATRNTPSSLFFDWITGGLNSQIEHHMFPTMARRNLTKMRALTRAAMLECGYAYEEMRNLEALSATVNALRDAAYA